MRRLALIALAVMVCAGGASAASGRGGTGSLRVVRYVDESRRARYANGTSGPRVLITTVHLPSGRGRRPLIVFCHGFALSPAAYARLVDGWTRAGYVVAAPAFPVESPGAPGGPTRADLPNEPADVAYLVTQLVRDFPGRVNPEKIAVAGQSDGGVAALSAAYDPRHRDPRIDAAIVMSGAPLTGFARPRAGSPPLLAIQGTADPYNEPAVTESYFRRLRRPKFLLWLIGASHLPPYTTTDRWSRTVEETTTAFLNHYLKNAPLAPLLADGRRPGVARIVGYP